MTEKTETNNMHDEKFMIDFPTSFPIKIMGVDCPELHQLVKEVVDKHVDIANQISISNNVSAKGKYIAITITIMAQNQAQVDAIYTELSGSKYVTMAL